MMFGFHERFTYFQCSRCRCLQIADKPLNMDKYYPPQYYSFIPKPGKEVKNPFEKALRRFQDHHTVFKQGIFGFVVSNFFPNRKLIALAKLELSLQTRILDVGCGAGWRLNALREIGFEHVMGIDPFLPADILYKNGVRVQKINIHEVTGTWDLIMYHHSFEHVPDPIHNLQIVARLLASGGCCLIRIPTVSSYAWEHYRENWFQLDAPRHFYLHSAESMNVLAERTGFIVNDIVFDSRAEQFQASEQYSRGVPLAAQGKDRFFAQSQIRAWKRQAKTLNRERKGDQAVFYLMKK
jgi:SAM-dependent methyltransferase